MGKSESTNKLEELVGGRGELGVGCFGQRQRKKVDGYFKISTYYRF